MHAKQNTDILRSSFFLTVFQCEENIQNAKIEDLNYNCTNVCYPIESRFLTDSSILTRGVSQPKHQYSRHRAQPFKIRPVAARKIDIVHGADETPKFITFPEWSSKYERQRLSLNQCTDNQWWLKIKPSHRFFSSHVPIIYFGELARGIVHLELLYKWKHMHAFVFMKNRMLSQHDYHLWLLQSFCSMSRQSGITTCICRQVFSHFKAWLYHCINHMGTRYKDNKYSLYTIQKYMRSVQLFASMLETQILINTPQLHQDWTTRDLWTASDMQKTSLRFN